jgi:hypothetical protein
LALAIQERPLTATIDFEKPSEAVLISPDDVSPDALSDWKREGFTSIVLLLDERFGREEYARAVQMIATESFDVYYWIEVGRNPTMAREHPEWVASLGLHDDWRKNFSNIPELGQDEVAKAWPWVPIGYKDAFAAHLSRIKTLVGIIPKRYRGILLNDLQGGPSACGCGNLQCRWALDYGVPGTTETIPGNDAAARFVAEVKKLTPGGVVIPVWTTECERQDMAVGKLPEQKWTTGFCGNVDCFNNCRDRFAEQWLALHSKHEGPTAILLLHKEFKRNRNEYGDSLDWMSQGVGYLQQEEIARVKPKALWLVVQGFDVTREEEESARRRAAKLAADLVIVARTRIEQSYEPRLLQSGGRIK